MNWPPHPHRHGQPFEDEPATADNDGTQRIADLRATIKQLCEEVGHLRRENDHLRRQLHQKGHP